MEDIIREVGAAVQAAIPRRLHNRWDTAYVEATYSPANGGTCSVTAECPVRGTGALHPIETGPRVAELFARLRDEMAAEGQPWVKAMLQLRSDRTFELDFKYE